MTAPTDAPVEERHRRAAADVLERFPSPSVERWFATGSFAEASRFLASVVRYELTKVAQALANAERDGRASRDAEVREGCTAAVEALLGTVDNYRRLDAAEKTVAKVMEHLPKLEAELVELRAYRRAWERYRWVHVRDAMETEFDCILAEELARKGTP